MISNFLYSSQLKLIYGIFSFLFSNSKKLYLQPEVKEDKIFTPAVFDQSSVLEFNIALMFTTENNT